MTTHYLNSLFAPKSVALVGASERAGSLGRKVFESLTAARFAGTIVPVNPKHPELFGVACAANLRSIKEPIDLAVIVTPATAVASVIDDCAAAGIHHAVVIAGGFGEAGAEGKALEATVEARAKAAGVRLIGPNCVGIMRPSIGLNATFAQSGARPGSIALVSQSGAVCTALIDWAWSAGFGFSSVISMGAAIDLDVGEILDYLLYDPETRSIVVYLEGVRDARRFVSALRAVARSKPIVIMKVGRHAAGERAARSHTGAMVGNDAVFDAALRRCGVVRVRSYGELFAVARLLAADRLPAGNRLGVVTNGGGPGVMVADLVSEVGLTLAPLSPECMTKLDALLPLHWSHANPVDILGDASGERFAGALEAVLADPNVDAVISLFCPQAVVGAEDTARALVPALRNTTKPVLTVWLGEAHVREARDRIEAAGIPAFATPEASVSALGALAQYQHAQQLLMETPGPLAMSAPPRLAEAHALAATVITSGRTLMTEPESKRLLACFGIASPETVIATSADAAAAAANRLGYPVALKILSVDIAHKSDVGGVRLNVRSADEVRAQFESLLADARRKRPDATIEGVTVQPMIAKRFGRELAIGVMHDPVFGPVVSFGAGGVAVELLADFAIGLPPLSARLAEDLIDQTRIARQLAAYRHVPAARRDAIVDTLLRVSDLIVACPWIAELDINPLLVDDTGAAALDARIIVDPSRKADDARYSRMAIRPYPSEMKRSGVLRDGSTVTVRPIRPEDAQLELAFFQSLSEHSRYLRFFSGAATLSPKMLARFTQVDYDNELALVAVRPAIPAEEMIGVARYHPQPDGTTCEFAVTIGDRWQGKGLGTLLMRQLVAAAKDAGYETMIGDVLSTNVGMLTLAHSLGFESSTTIGDGGVVRVSRAL